MTGPAHYGRYGRGGKGPQPGSPRTDLQGLPMAEQVNIRMEIAAEELFENVLRRRNWLAQDRDRVAAFLGALVAQEIKKQTGGRNNG